MGLGGIITDIVVYTKFYVTDIALLVHDAYIIRLHFN